MKTVLAIIEIGTDSDYEVITLSVSHPWLDENNDFIVNVLPAIVLN